MTKPGVISQKQMMEIAIPLIKEEGAEYRKFKKVWAKEALGGERITTRTSDGIETRNQAKPGDFIVKNQTTAGELYIIKAATFYNRYQYHKEGTDGFAQYHPIGKVLAIEITSDFLSSLQINDQFQFMAPWGQPEIMKPNDFLASPLDFSEVYRIARMEFFETYELVTKS